MRQEVGRIDFGTAAARRQLRDGWYDNERGRGGETFVWGRGEASSLDIFLAARRPVRADLRCAPAPGLPGPQVVTVEVNGRRAAELTLSPTLRPYSIGLSAELLHAGDNRLTFRYRFTTPRRRAGTEDRRRLAVAFHDLRLVPLPGRSAAPRADATARTLVLPWGTEVAYVLDLAGAARLAVGGVERVGRGVGGLVAAAQEEDQVEKELGRFAGDSAGIEPVGLPGSGRRLVRLALRAVPEPGSGHLAGGLRIRAPALLAPEDAADPLPALALDPRAAQGAGSTPAPPPHRPNVLVYLIDALRPDRLGCYGSRRGLSPRIDAFAAGALVFEQAVAQATWTRPAVASVMTGLTPLQHGVRTLDDRLPAAAATLAERLRAAGYATAAFSTNAHVTAETGFAQGFAHFDYEPEDTGSVALNRRVLAWLDGARVRPGGPPFFAYVHALDPHAPYDPPPDLRQRIASGLPPEAGSHEAVVRAYGARGAERARRVADLVRLYDGEVAANDRSFGALLDALAARRLLDGTVVILLADHGEEFDEHRALGHANNLYSETLRIPLIVRLPDETRGRRVRRLAQQIDIFPTVLAQAGLTLPRRLAGIDLTAAPPAGERPAFSHLSYSDRAGASVVLGDWKLIQPLTPAFGRRAQLFRRDGGVWRETVDLAGRSPVRAAHLAAFLRAERLAARRGLAAERAVVDPAARRALEALGYL